MVEVLGLSCLHLQICKGFVEPDVVDTAIFPPQSNIQFERLGFFTPDGPCEFVLAEAMKNAQANGTNHNNVYKRPAGELPIFNLTVGLIESFTVSKEKEEEAKKAKEREQEARRKAAEERQRKKEQREAAKLQKEAEKRAAAEANE